MWPKFSYMWNSAIEIIFESSSPLTNLVHVHEMGHAR